MTAAIDFSDSPNLRTMARIVANDLADSDTNRRKSIRSMNTQVDLREAPQSRRVEPMATPKPPRFADTARLPVDVSPYTELANAHRLAALHGNDLRFAPSLGWTSWGGKRWQIDATGEARRRMHDVVRSLHRQAADALDRAADADDESVAKKLVARAQALSAWAQKSQGRRAVDNALAMAEVFEGIATAADVFDADPWLLNCGNASIDLRTGEAREHRRDDLATKIAPVDYDAQAIAPTWRTFLLRIFGGDADLISFVQRAVGYSLTGLTTEQVFFLLWGSGANGKSTFLEVLRDVIGDYAANTSADVLMASFGGRGADNDIARLRGARFVSASESGEGRRLDEERVKRLTGGDVVTARFLYREHFEFRPQFKLWLATNSKPEIRGVDHAMWRRVRLIPFNVTIPAAEQDRELGAKLRAEAPGILRWAIDGCLAWQRDGLKAPEAVTSATAEYRAEQNVVGRFIDETCVIAEHATAMAGAIYGAFVDWCRETGEEALSAVDFGRRLGADGRFKVMRTNRGRCWRGIGLIAGQAMSDVG